jgi:hypothetical protein
LLDKILDKDGKIPSGKQVSDMQEELRVAYFNSMTADNPTDPVSSEDEATKTSRLEDVARARANKLDKFHPMDLYIYFYYGPASVGGCASPYFLESAAAIQQAVKEADCTNRVDLRKRNEKEQLEKMQGKKARKLLKDCVDEMEECGPTTSFGEAYGKQLELEEVRVETERSREQRENTQYLITMYQGLIAEATTPQEKSEYQAEVLLLMKQAVTPTQQRTQRGWVQSSRQRCSSWLLRRSQPREGRVLSAITSKREREALCLTICNKQITVASLPQ